MPNFSLRTVEGSGNETVRIGQVIDMLPGPALIQSTDGIQKYLAEGNYVETGYSDELKVYSGVPGITGATTVGGMTGNGKALRTPSGDNLYIVNPGATWVQVGGVGEWIPRVGVLVSGTVPSSHVMEEYGCEAVAITQSGVLYASFWGKVLKSSDYGVTWSDAGVSLTFAFVYSIVVTQDGSVLIGGRDGDDFAAIRRINAGGVHSTPTGYGDGVNGTIVGMTVINSGTVFAANTAGAVYSSVDNGASWASSTSQSSAYSLATNGTEVILSNSLNSTLKVRNSAGTWTVITPGVIPTALFLNYVNGAVYGSSVGTVYKSTDFGVNWTIVTVPSGYISGGRFSVAGNFGNSVVFRTFTKPVVTLDNVTYSAINTVGCKSFSTRTIAVGKTSLVAVLDAFSTINNIATSSDQGNTWTIRSSGMMFNNGLHSVGDNTFIAVRGSSEARVSHDGGVTWISGYVNNGTSSTFTNDMSRNLVAKSGSTLLMSLAAAPGEVHYSQDNGSSFYRAYTTLGNTSSVVYFQSANSFVVAGSLSSSNRVVRADVGAPSNYFPVTISGLNNDVLCLETSKNMLAVLTSQTLYLMNSSFAVVTAVALPVSSTNWYCKHVGQNTWIITTQSRMWITYDNFSSVTEIPRTAPFSNFNTFFGVTNGSFITGGFTNKNKAYGLPLKEGANDVSRYLRIM